MGRKPKRGLLLCFVTVLFMLAGVSWEQCPLGQPIPAFCLVRSAMKYTALFCIGLDFLEWIPCIMKRNVSFYCRLNRC